VARIDRLVRGVQSAMSMRTASARVEAARIENARGLRGHARATSRSAAGHADELDVRSEASASGRSRARERTYQRLRLTLERSTCAGASAACAAGLIAGDARLQSAIHKRTHTLTASLGASAARLDSLSPLAVLGRATLSAGTRIAPRIVRDASRIEKGSQVLVTIEKGELDLRSQGQETLDSEIQGSGVRDPRDAQTEGRATVD
jgi:exonuclease VII large subunit